MTDESDLSKLNHYMGGYGSDDAAQFTAPTPSDGSGEVVSFPPSTAKLGESRAGSLAVLINDLRREHSLTFDQAVQMWLLSTYAIDIVRFPPPTGT